MGVFAICNNKKQQIAHNFVCLFVCLVFSIPRNFLVVRLLYEKLFKMNEWHDGYLYNLLQNEVNNAHNFVCLFVFFLHQISIVVLVVWG